MAANSATITAPGTISPKVFWPVVVGLVLTFVGTFLAAITPDMLSGLGAFAVPMAMALTAVAQGITAYLKRDELRDIGAEATAAVVPAAPSSSTVATDVEPVDEVDVAPADEAVALEQELASLGNVDTSTDPETPQVF